jgi:hypothetical protein
MYQVDILCICQSDISPYKAGEGEEGHEYFLVTAMFGEMVYMTYLKWYKDAAEILGDK